jgi:glycine cleavage system protein P-like pyridoxal-binding family
MPQRRGRDFGCALGNAAVLLISWMYRRMMGPRPSSTRPKWRF